MVRFLLLLSVCFGSLFGSYLRISDRERAEIHEIISILGENYAGALLFKKSHLEKLGESVYHVPPLQFIGYAVTDPYLFSCLHKIKGSYFKWGEFVKGFGKKMGKDLDAGILIEEMADFAHAIGMHEGTLLSFVHRRDWEGFLLFIMKY